MSPVLAPAIERRTQLWSSTGIKRGSKRLAFASSLAACLCLSTAGSAQEEHPLWVRLGAGAGVGNFQLAGRLGASSEYWPSRPIGLGIHLGTLAQTSIRQSGVAWLAGPQVLLRSKVNASESWLLGISSGYAFNAVRTTWPCDASDCVVRVEREEASSGYGALEFGYFVEGAVLLGGIALRLDALGWPATGNADAQLAATLNVVGGVLPL
jgi:hypothetical protein